MEPVDEVYCLDEPYSPLEGNLDSVSNLPLFKLLNLKPCSAQSLLYPAEPFLRFFLPGYMWEVYFTPNWETVRSYGRRKGQGASHGNQYADHSASFLAAAYKTRKAIVSNEERVYGFYDFN